MLINRLRDYQGATKLFVMEQKYRAWDRATKRMLEKDFHLIGEVMAFGIIEQRLMEMPLDRTTLDRIGDVEVTQATGLKDKRGDKVYDKDIYRHNGKNFYIIQIKSHGLCAVEINKNFGKIVEDLTLRQNHNWKVFADIYNIQKYIEIIGNSFENPELLQEKSHTLHNLTTPA